MGALRDLSISQQVGLLFLALFGILTLVTVIEVSRTIRDLTRAKLLAALRALKMRVAGLDLDFSSGDIAASRFVELVQVRHDGRFVR